MYASYQDYTQRFGGRAIPDEAAFNRLAIRADAVLDRITLGRAAKYRDVRGRLAMACCAVAEKLQEQEEALLTENGGGRIAAEQVGDHRVQYRTQSRLDLNAEMAALAELYLTGTGLLYRGIPVFGNYEPEY